MSPIRVGDRVKVVDREVNAADVKSGLFYDYFRNLTGTAQHVYDDNTVCVQVDLDSLPEDVHKRHLEVQESVKRRWLGGLSQEARERLTEKEKQVTLSYNILVDARDLEVLEKGKRAAGPRTEQPAATTPPASTGQTPTQKVKLQQKDQQARRPTEADFEKAEERYLRSIAARHRDGKA